MGFTLNSGLSVKYFEVWPFEERAEVSGRTGVGWTPLLWSARGLVVFRAELES